MERPLSSDGLSSDGLSSDELSSDEVGNDLPLRAEDAGPLVRRGVDLRTFTAARIGLARTGVSLTTRDTLAFALDHAQARDAVHVELDVAKLVGEFKARGLAAVAVESAAPDKPTYLRRPDLGRRLSEVSRAVLDAAAKDSHEQKRLTIILADGLSALATERHGLVVADALLALLGDAWHLTAIVVAERARVALGDEIGVVLGAQVTVMLIGERPGMSAADSLGAYITWAPRIGRTNAERNCISNIRGEGLAPAAAAARIAFYLREADRLQMTGVALKDPELPATSHALPE